MMKEMNLLEKMKQFFKRIFSNTKMLPKMENPKNENPKNENSKTENPKNENMQTENLIMEEIKATNIDVTDKKQFFDLYESLKDGNNDILSVDPEISNKMCKLLSEEIKIKKRLLNEKLEQIAELDKNILALKSNNS